MGPRLQSLPAGPEDRRSPRRGAATLAAAAAFIAGGLSLTLTLGLLVVAGAGCASPAARQAWLSRFFDGVPVPGDPAAPEATEETSAAPPTNFPSLSLSRRVDPADPATLTVSIHPPYARRECQECHSARFSNALRLPADQLCLGCHPKVLADAPFTHSPAGSGECLACHHPHATETRSLLLKKAPALCLQCHDTEFLSPVEAHRNAAQADCLLCHEPHHGSNQHLLRTAGAGNPPPRP